MEHCMKQEGLEGQVVRSKTAIKWEMNYQALKNYRKKFGHCKVPCNYEENRVLGHWVSNQRQYYKKGKLSSTQINLLNQLEFEWRVTHPTWSQRYEELKAYKERFGNCQVSQRYVESPGLGMWVSKQRQSFKQQTLTTEQFQLLEAIGFEFSNFKERRWDEMFEELLAYKQVFGDCKVPINYKENPSLGVWVMNLRNAYRRGILNPEKITRLNQVGFEWGASKHERWDRKYNQLKTYYETYQHCDIKHSEKEYASLNIWIAKQRQLYSEGRLCEARIDRLNQLGFNWEGENIREKNWNQMYDQLVEYYNRFGHCDVSPSQAQNLELAQWVVQQRRMRKRNKLSQARQIQLNQLGFKWELHEYKWLKMYQQLVKYYEKHGCCRVPIHSEEHRELATWIAHQRSNYRKNKLSQDRIDLLNELGFNWGKPIKSKWGIMYEKLKIFNDKHGHCNVPSRYKEDISLGVWVVHQRQMYRKENLSSDRIDLLNELGFEWKRR